MDNMKEIIFFAYKNKVPIQVWLASLDSSNRNRVLARLARLEENNYGDYKKLDDEIYELRFKFGSGYRIYFAEIDNVIILLLNAGNKSTQSKDIKKAKEYLNIWKDSDDE